MAQITIYRIENENGLGPYYGNTFGPLERMIFKHNMSDLHPGSEDFVLESEPENIEQYVFGFQTLEQLKSWFEGFISEVEYLGYKIVQFQIDESKIIVGKSGRQIIFRKEDAEMK